MSHYARFTGYNSVKRYGYHESMVGAPGKVYEYNSPIPYEAWADTNLIYEGNLDSPILESGARIHLHTLNTTVDILKVERSTDNIYTYLTNYEIENIENEITIATQAAAQIQFERAQEKWDRIGFNRSEYEPDKDSWWKRLFS
jgi:hypothetical protein